MKADLSRRAKISGLGLVTALGDDPDANLAGLHRAGSVRQCRTLDTAGGPVEVPYLSLDQATDPMGDESTGGGVTFVPVGRAVAQALAEAGLDASELRTMPLFVGSSSYAIGQSEALYAEALAGASSDSGANSRAAPLAVPLPGFSQVSRYLQIEYDLCGADFLFNTACTSSANALLVAAEHIESGRCDRALVIGMELVNATTLAGFYGMQLLADDVMRPFDLRRDGLVLGEGCGAILLCAAQPGDDGLFVAGGASGCDTFSISTSNPDGSRIATVMNEALANAGITAGDITAIKAHGTASPLNDNAEAAGLSHVFATLPPLFALKSRIGHTLGACGAIEAGLVASSLFTGVLPPTGGFEVFDEKLGVRPLTEALPSGAGYYMLNFFGFGGNNASVILEYVCRDGRHGVRREI